MGRLDDINDTLSSRLHGLREKGVVCNRTLSGIEIFEPPRQLGVHVVERVGDVARNVYYLSKKFLNAPKHEQEDMMAGKKKTEQKSDDPRAWHKKAMSVFMEQVGDGKGLDGYTFAEIRKIMGLTDPKEPGYNEVALAITELRNEGFLAHKFAHPSLKEDFFEGDPLTDIPNIQKRENEQKLKQLVFFVHPAALALGDDVLAAVEAGEYPEDHEYDTNSTVFDRDQVYAWFDGLGEIIDLYVTDEEQKATSAKLIAALMPAKSE